MVIYCKFAASEEPCTNIFQEILLDEGVCCVFNRLHPFFLYKVNSKFLRDFTSINGRSSIPVNWNLESGYKTPLPKNYYPKKAAGLGVSLGLTVVLNANVDEYYCSSTNGAGFKFLLTNPVDSSEIKEIGLPIMLGHQTRVRINTKRLESDPSLLSIKLKDRQCYFMTEKKLQSFKYYTRRYCEAECNAWQILRSCNCTPYSMPQMFDNAPKCFLSEMDCVQNSIRLMQSPENLKCKEDCLPSCHYMSYLPDLFVTPLARRIFNLQNSFFRNISMDTMKNNLAMVEIFYTDSNFRPAIKLPYTGLTEFLSQSGGVMSLMVGFSVISLAEIFYFVLLKPSVDMILRRNPMVLKSINDDVPKNNKTPKDKYHHKILLKRCNNINNRVMNCNKDELQKYCNEKY